MMIVTCPMCGKRIRYRDEIHGRKGRCPNCGESVVLNGVQQISVRPTPAPNLVTNLPAIETHETVEAADDVNQPKPPRRMICPECKTAVEFPADQEGASGQCGACEAAITFDSTPPSIRDRLRSASAKRSMALACIIFGGLFAAGTRQSEPGLETLLGNACVVAVVVSIVYLFVHRAPERFRKLILWGGVIAGVGAAIWHDETARYTESWVSTDGNEYFDKYTRDRVLVKRTIVWKGGGMSFGPMSESGKPHGRWMDKGRYRWFFYGEEVSEADWHRANRN